MEFPASRLPALLRHMTMAIFENLSGSQRKRFLSAFEISRSRLTEWGYLTPPSKSGPLEGITLTSKGIKQNRKHLNEGRKKNMAFEQYYEAYRADIEMKTAKKDSEED